MEIQQIISEVVGIIRKYLPSEYRVILFGSWAKGDASETSDVDIGVLGPNRVEWSIMSKITDDIEDIRTLRSIDIVDLRVKGERFRENVMASAKVLD